MDGGEHRESQVNGPSVKAVRTIPLAFHWLECITWALKAKDAGKMLFEL